MLPQALVALPLDIEGAFAAIPPKPEAAAEEEEEEEEVVAAPLGEAAAGQEAVPAPAPV